MKRVRKQVLTTEIPKFNVQPPYWIAIMQDEFGRKLASYDFLPIEKRQMWYDHTGKELPKMIEAYLLPVNGNSNLGLAMVYRFDIKSILFYKYGSDAEWQKMIQFLATGRKNDNS